MQGQFERLYSFKADVAGIEFRADVEEGASRTQLRLSKGSKTHSSSLSCEEVEGFAGALGRAVAIRGETSPFPQAQLSPAGELKSEGDLTLSLTAGNRLRISKQSDPSMFTATVDLEALESLRRLFADMALAFHGPGERDAEHLEPAARSRPSGLAEDEEQ